MIKLEALTGRCHELGQAWARQQRGHIRKVAGVEAIGIGADFDGMPSGPVGFEDVSGYPALFAELVRRGYSQVELEMIASRNALRVLREAEFYAASQRDAAPIETRIGSSQ